MLVSIDNLLGEKILDGFFSNIFCLITAKFSYLEYSKYSKYEFRDCDVDDDDYNVDDDNSV